MPQYVVLGTHAPSQCPGANGSMREIFRQLVEAAPGIAAQHGVTVVTGPVHLDPAHKVLVILEAANQDAVQDTLQANRLAQIQDLEVYRATPLPEMFAHAQPPLY